MLIRRGLLETPAPPSVLNTHQTRLFSSRDSSSSSNCSSSSSSDLEIILAQTDRHGLQFEFAAACSWRAANPHSNIVSKQQQQQQQQQQHIKGAWWICVFAVSFICIAKHALSSESRGKDCKHQGSQAPPAICVFGAPVLLGDTGVGKSSLALRFCRGRFPLYHEVTIGAAFLQQTVRLGEGNQLKLYIWDTGGQERFRAMAPLYYRDAAGAVVVYDITAPSSLDAVKFWTGELRQHLSRCSIAVAANKWDLLQQQQQEQQQQQQQEQQQQQPTDASAVPQQPKAEPAPQDEKVDLTEIDRGIENVRSFCASNNFNFVECSARTGYNVNRLFEDLARDMFTQLKDAGPVEL
ncbi:hypothetical protein Esti_005924 [Eimeria stiedai]